jgi:hypothetical protein
MLNIKGTAAPASRNITSCGYGSRRKAGTTCVFVARLNFKQPKTFSRRVAPEVLHEHCPSRNEGAGNTGCTLHPRSRVQQVHKKTHTSIQVQRRQSGIPCAMVLTLIPRSPRRIGLCCLRRLRIWFCPPGRARKTSADLTPTSEASGPHDLAVRFSAVRLRERSTAHGVSRPAIKSCARALPRPPHPAPTFVTMANAPLKRTGWRII